MFSLASLFSTPFGPGLRWQSARRLVRQPGKIVIELATSDRFDGDLRTNQTGRLAAGFILRVWFSRLQTLRRYTRGSIRIHDESGRQSGATQTEILRDISLSFFPGAKIGVLGLNGAGKSTLLRIMAGVDTEFNGEARAQAGIRIGYLPQEPELDESLDVGNVELGVSEIKSYSTDSMK